MAEITPTASLRIGILGSGFMANFHLQAFVGVRNARIAGVFSPTAANREAFAARADDLDLGPCVAYDSVEALAESPEIDAIWICGPNDTRLDHMRAIHGVVTTGRGSLRGVACEKPLGRNLAEAREMVRLVEDAGLNHGYLENQVFAPAVQRGKEIIWRRGVPSTGRPYLARAAEEHSGPHNPWFWQGDRQGGGVLSDMMCHSVEVARFLLTQPGQGRESLTITSANATVATLKWSRPEYVAQLRETMGAAVDYAQHPAEDFARATLTFLDEVGAPVIVEATTSWSYVGPGLRIQLELLGPEYSMAFNSLNSGLSIFLSRHVGGQQGEDLVEKQGAEQGLLPVLEDEAGTYGYTAEDRHMVEAFRKGTPPLETFHDGAAVVEILMALYRSAELGRTIALPDEALATYQPPVARSRERGGHSARRDAEERRGTMRLAGKVAVVTGGGGPGIGSAIAGRFAREGAQVVVVDLDAARAEEVAAQIVAAGGTAIGLHADVTQAAAVEALAAQALATYGRVDILVNNAGRSYGDDIRTIDEETWDRNFAVVLKSVFLCAKALVPTMIAQGSGAIINISSVNGLTGLGEEAYGAAKAGMINLTQNLAVKYGRYGVRANCICPGTIRTPAWERRRTRDPQVFERLTKWYPLGRVGEPTDIANAALFLASDEASWLTGAIIPVDGGLMAGNGQMNRELVGDV